jgi:NAD(P)H dehydrogenase (quinone)
MKTETTTFGVTGATGKLGAHAIDLLLLEGGVPATSVVAFVRNASSDIAKGFAARGVVVREANYDDGVEKWEKALAGIDRLLLISSSEVGKRLPQHEAVVKAAKRAGVEQLAYTSILHASTSRMMLAGEHKATEEVIRVSGIPSWTLLRNGWYTENFTESLASAVEHGVIVGSTGDGKIAAAARRDFAAAAVAVLRNPALHKNKTYELAGDQTFTKGELAAEVGRQIGRPVEYKDLPASDFAKALESFGLPEPFAKILADCDEGVRRGELEEPGGDLHRLIGRATTPLNESIRAALPSP